MTATTATTAETAHRDPFARDRMPPRETWPVFRFNAETDNPARVNCVTELLERHVAAGQGTAGRPA